MRPNFPSLEAVLKRMGDEPGWGAKFFIGGFLFFIPGLHIFSLGYLLQYARRIRARNDLDLPEWREWGRMFMDGMRLLVVWLIFFLVPVLVGLGLTFAYEHSVPDILGLLNLAWGFTAAGWLVGCYFYMAALYRFVAVGALESLFDLRTIWRMAFAMRWQLALPVLVFTGIFVLFWPVYGLVFFMGFLILTAYSTLNYVLLERAAGIHR